MSYKLLSFHTSHEHDLTQWNQRSLAGELRSFEGRTLVRSFDRFLNGKQADILEAGCGFGAWCEWFRARGHNIIGVEYDQRVVERAQAFKEDVAVELGDVTDLRFSDNHFDAYISLGVIEHFEHGPEKALQEAHRVLRPDGLAFVSTPAVTVMRRVLSHRVRSLYFTIRRLRGKPSYFWEYRFTRRDLVGHLERAGFEIVYVDIDDYEPDIKDRHIGLCADWFFLRKQDGEIWELNTAGKIIRRVLDPFPPQWYTSAFLVVARAKK